MDNSHVPVMLQEVKTFIPRNRKLNLIDATFGGGSYSKAMLEEFKNDRSHMAVVIDYLVSKNYSL